LPAEYQQVVSSLGKQGDYKATALHNHFFAFLHYSATGPAEKLATGFKAALSELGKAKGSSTAAK
jgi:Domain of Unknown Function (DUF1259)